MSFIKCPDRVAFRPSVLLGSLLVVSVSAATHCNAQQLWGNQSDRLRTTTSQPAALGWQGENWMGSVNESHGQWRLGVVGDNLETGVQVRTVARGSAAEVTGIEPGDLIVNVGGYQVGLVEGRLYDLSEEVNRRADTNGLISVIVQDHRTGRISAVRVQLKGSEDYVRGTIQYRSRNPLPSDAMVTVEIQNLSRPYHEINQSNNRFPVATSGDIPFEVAYDPTHIEPQDLYEIRATVTSGGRTIFHTAQSQRVITRGNPKQVRLQLVALDSVVGNYPGGTGNTITAGYSNYNVARDEIARLYLQYLGRNPKQLELIAWQDTDLSQLSIAIPLKLMASQEYFDRVGNNSTVWIQQVFEVIVGKRPTQREIDGWMQRYVELRSSRTELLRQLQVAATK